MASSLFNRRSPQSSGPFSRLSEARSAVSNLVRAANGDADAAARLLAQRNPRFAEFMRENQGMSVDQLAQKYGVNPDQLKRML